MISVDLQQEAFRQKILAATRLLAVSVANYSLSKAWARSAMNDDLAAEYILVRAQIEYALKETSVLMPGERQTLLCFKTALDDIDNVLHLDGH